MNPGAAAFAGGRQAAPQGRRTPCNDEKDPMQKYICDVCGWVYDPALGDPENGVAAGTSFADIPDGWVCPECGAGKDEFSLQA